MHSLSLTPFGKSPYVCIHDMCVSACTCMCVHMDANMSLCTIYYIMHECECAYIHYLEMGIVSQVSSRP